VGGFVDIDETDRAHSLLWTYRVDQTGQTEFNPLGTFRPVGQIEWSK
jgi:hypothetical protein